MNCILQLRCKFKRSRSCEFRAAFLNMALNFLPPVQTLPKTHEVRSNEMSWPSYQIPQLSRWRLQLVRCQGTSQHIGVTKTHLRDFRQTSPTSKSRQLRRAAFGPFFSTPLISWWISRWSRSHPKLLRVAPLTAIPTSLPGSGWYETQQSNLGIRLVSTMKYSW